MTLTKHLVITRYYDYDSYLETSYSTATAVDGAITYDGFHYSARSLASDAVDAWLTEYADEAGKVGIRLDRGEVIERRVNLNPQGLM